MLKSCHGVELLSPNRYESDISNEVLYALVGQVAAKISEVKVGGRKKTCLLARFDTVHTGHLFFAVSLFEIGQLDFFVFLIASINLKTSCLEKGNF